MGNGQMGPLRDLGPCIVLYNNVDLGATYGDVVFRYQEEDAAVYEDQAGTSSVDDINVGAVCEVEIPLSRMALSSLSSLIVGASGSGTSGTTMTVKSAVGASRYDRAKELVLKPVLVQGEADTNTATWLHIFKASPRPNFEITYNNSGQRVYRMTFKGYPDRSVTSPNNRYFRIGPAI